MMWGWERTVLVVLSNIFSFGICFAGDFVVVDCGSAPPARDQIRQLAKKTPRKLERVLYAYLLSKFLGVRLVLAPPGWHTPTLAFVPAFDDGFAVSARSTLVFVPVGVDPLQFVGFALGWSGRFRSNFCKRWRCATGALLRNSEA